MSNIYGEVVMLQTKINDKVILIGRCSHDSDVEYPHYWMEEVISEARKLDFEVIDLDGKNFRKKTVTKILKEKQPFMVIFCGHGKEYSINGHNNRKVIELCFDDYLLKDKIVFSISCYTGGPLAKSSRNKGCKCYIGWDDRLGITSKSGAEPSVELAQASTPIEALEVLIEVLGLSFPIEFFNTFLSTDCFSPLTSTPSTSTATLSESAEGFTAVPSVTSSLI